MEKLIPSFKDITLWQKQNFVNTGGTRAKFVALNEKEEIYYFKGSKEAPDGSIRYPLEFWSEIISSKIGQSLGFEMLDYNIGYDSNHIQKIGCLSKSMIIEKHERLTEGITYLKGYSPNYDPVKDKKDYTFKFINDALIHHKINIHLPFLIDTIIFDCVIGNSDRHQENWGFIRKYIEISLNEKSQPLSKKVETNLFTKVKNAFVNKRKQEVENARKSNNVIRLNFNNTSRFSPIYDSGCCLAREKNNAEILEMNKDIQIIERYINKGKSEIHWEGKKITHFELVENLLNNYGEIVNNRLKVIKSNFKIDEIEAIIFYIDSQLPDFCNEYKITPERKDVIIKILNLRIEKLLSL
ncbi:hypothetical protein [Chryseobacterium sp. MP_3.2]|uniref:hypothetical protein n=1 Tax=Chryseobacterium sp. MP_3.2 TaxID=3071712 RepID=UPI002DF881E3|nr:hypothetical protein [Chryseobacterium sp. MP_3.2]